MDSKKIIAVIIGVLLSIASAFFGYNFKGDVCAPTPIVENEKP